MNKKGVTLFELLVYIGLFAIISLLIGRQFKLLINNYSSGKQTSRQQTDIRDVLGLMVREIRNMGLKTYFTGAGGMTKITKDGITVNETTDLSSFNHTQQGTGAYNDALEFFKIQVDDDGDYKRTETIKYYVEGTTLRRDFQTDVGFPKHTNSVVAENVYALQFQYGVLGADDLVFDQDPLTTASWTHSGAATWTTANKSLTLGAGGGTGYLKYPKTGTAPSITANQKYSIFLTIEPSGGFPDNLNWLKFSFQNSGRTTTYGSEQFKPYPGTTVSLTVAVTSSLPAYAYLDYSATGAGTLVISGIEVHCSELGAYDWKDNPATAEKVNVRAIKMYVLTRTKGKATSSAEDKDIIVGEKTYTASGEYTWRLYTETIETPNNGIF
ncbi:MAG: hypothetical protein JW913_03915 [Chitinispirillaceae bacterium]|nr:hypothetical protein [Chitinispirillaceae bacterium]